jgi:hypothetical protein
MQPVGGSGVEPGGLVYGSPSVAARSVVAEFLPTLTDDESLCEEPSDTQ